MTWTRLLLRDAVAYSVQLPGGRVLSLQALYDERRVLLSLTGYLSDRDARDAITWTLPVSDGGPRDVAAAMEILKGLARKHVRDAAVSRALDGTRFVMPDDPLLRPPPYYHVTPVGNLASIERDGLVPAIGPRSRSVREEKPYVYLFHDAGDLEDAAANWFDEAFDEDETLVRLTLDLPEDVRAALRYDPDMGYEVLSPVAIPASAICGKQIL